MEKQFERDIMQKIILLSILPEWAEAILNGTKKWEYRRVPPKTENGTKIVLYASGKRQAIVGEFICEVIIREDLDSLINKTLRETPHDAKDLYLYFSGLEIASAIKVKNPMRYEHAIELNEIRHAVPNFNPPQNFIYLKESEPPTKKIIVLLPNTESEHHQKGLFDY